MPSTVLHAEAIREQETWPLPHRAYDCPDVFALPPSSASGDAPPANQASLMTFSMAPRSSVRRAFV